MFSALLSENEKYETAFILPFRMLFFNSLRRRFYPVLFRVLFRDSVSIKNLKIMLDIFRISAIITHALSVAYKWICESAGTGRQARLRGVCQPTWEFKSPLSHYKYNSSIWVSCFLFRKEETWIRIRKLPAAVSFTSSKTGEHLYFSPSPARWKMHASLLSRTIKEP